MTSAATQGHRPVTGSNVPFGATLAAAQLGEEWAVSALWRDMHPRLLRYLRASVARGSAEDLASDVWLDAARGLRRFEGDERAFRAWLFTIARRRVVDALRAHRRRGTYPVDTATLDRLTTQDEGELAARQALDAALDRIAALPADQAQVVLLRVLGDLSLEDTAKILGKRAGTVGVLQHRALRKLAAQEKSDEV
jgi:RNA polymerase sigma-70 factor (ECF subfamily)